MPDSSVYLNDGVKRLVSALPDLWRAINEKNPARFFILAFPLDS